MTVTHWLACHYFNRHQPLVGPCQFIYHVNIDPSPDSYMHGRIAAVTNDSSDKIRTLYYPLH